MKRFILFTSVGHQNNESFMEELHQWSDHLKYAFAVSLFIDNLFTLIYETGTSGEKSAKVHIASVTSYRIAIQLDATYNAAGYKLSPAWSKIYAASFCAYNSVITWNQEIACTYQNLQLLLLYFSIWNFWTGKLTGTRMHAHCTCRPFVLRMQLLQMWIKI